MKREEIKRRNRIRSALFEVISIKGDYKINESKEDKKLRELLYDQNRIKGWIDRK